MVKPFLKQLVVYFLLLLTVSGCSLYSFRIKEAKSALASRQFDKALEELKPLAFKNNDDQLVYLLDYAMVLQYAGRFQESNQVLEQAGQLAEIKDYHSVTRLAGSLIGSQSLVQYKGENFEKILINAFAAINYLMLENLDSALVEARRLNEKLYRFRSEGGKKYEQNAFARYISAIAWEEDGKFDDAYIDYEKAYELNSNFRPLRKDLIRLAKLSDRREMLKKWQAQFPGEAKEVFKEIREKESGQFGELVVIYQQGWGPVKRPHPNWPRIPKLVRIPSLTKKAKVIANGQSQGISEALYSIEKSAIATMEEDYAGLIAKRVAARVLKHKVADKIREKDKGLGQLAFLVMDIVDQADLRQWGSLPAEIHLLRVKLPLGKHSIEIRGVNSVGLSSGESLPSVSIDIRAGKTKFLNWRSFR